MSIPAHVRDQVRAIYNYQCGYCGVTELLSGGPLEIDHFQPRRHGGTDAPDNLVYACATCNRFKSDYWPSAETPSNLRLLHPRQDDLAQHISIAPNGLAIGLTAQGWFHIQWLHLNRAQLIALRQLTLELSGLQHTLRQTQVANQQLRDQIRLLEDELNALRALLRRLVG